MAGFYHTDITIVSRENGTGKAAAKFAYARREDVVDLDTGEVKRPNSNEDDLEARGIVFPEWLSDDVKRRWQDMAVLSQDIEHAEKKADGQLLRQFIVALDKNLSEQQRLEAVQDICKSLSSEGMFAVYAIHKEKNDNGNFHAHILTPIRQFDADGNFKKIKQKRVYCNCIKNGKPSYDPALPKDETHRIPVINRITGKQKIEKTGRRCWQRITIERNPWDNRGNAERWRKMIADIENKYLSDEKKVDWRSYERQGIEGKPEKKSDNVAKRIQERYEKAIGKLPAEDQKSWLRSIIDAADADLPEGQRKEAERRDEEYKKKLSKVSWCKPSKKYSDRSGLSDDDYKTRAIFILETLKSQEADPSLSVSLSEKLRESEDQIRRDILIIHNFGMTSEIKKHFEDANIFLDRKIEKLESRLSDLREKEVINEGIRSAADGLVAVVANTATAAEYENEDRAAREFNQNIIRTTELITRELIRAAADLAKTDVKDRRAFIRESRAEIASARYKERTAREKRSDRIALRIGQGTGESQSYSRKI